MMVVIHLKEERKVGVIFEVILTRGPIINMVGMDFSLHTSRRMMETWR